MGDHHNALLDIFVATESFPEDAYLRALYGLCLQKVGRADESIAEFTHALSLNPRMKCAYLGRGNVYAVKQEYELCL